MGKLFRVLSNLALLGLIGILLHHMATSDNIFVRGIFWLLMLFIVYYVGHEFFMDCPPSLFDNPYMKYDDCKCY